MTTDAKVLIFDIETAPIKAYTWSKWPKAIQDSQIIEDWFMICWSAKWLFKNEQSYMVLNSKEAKNCDDKRITEGLWQMVEEADIVIAHNFKKFDRKRMNTRFLQHSLPPPSPYVSLDTLEHARKHFSITSNRLDYIAQRFFGLEGKMKTDWDLWNGALMGDSKSLEDMAKYCNQDVLVLEDVYLKIRPWMRPHPQLGWFTGSSEPVCGYCMSNNITWLNKPYRTYVNTYEAFRCNDCGGVCRSRKANTPKAIKDRLAVNIPQG